MAGIQAPGVGSNLDINSIVTQLVAAEKAPTEKRLASNEALVQARLSSLGLVKSSLSEFQTAVRSLSVSTAFQSKSVNIANESLFTATVSSAAKPGRYSVEVSSLAQSQKLVSKSFNGTATTVGTGTLHIEFGSYDSGTNVFAGNPDLTAVDIEIGADKSSLQGIRDAVNAAGAGVTASILNDGTGDRLVFSSESGAKSSMKITVTNDASGTDTDSTSGLSQLAYDPTKASGSGRNMTETLAAKDALVLVDGISITRPTNSVTGVLPGVTLDLNEMAPGSPTTLTISENKESIKTAVESFVDSYNKLKTVLKDATKYDSQQKKGAVLIGDSAIRSINSQMQHVLGGVIEGVSGQVRALADIGITSARDGTLQLDSAKLGSALSSNIDGFAALFSTAGSSSDSLIDYVKAGAGTKVGQYAVNISQVATQSVYTNTVGTGTFAIDANNDTFKIKVDGLQSGLITLTQGTGLTGAALAQEMQSQINADSALKEGGRSVSVAYDSTAGVMKITSNRYGSDSKIDVTQIESTSSAIGLTIMSGTVGLDVAGTIGGFAATGVGTKLTGTGDAEGLQINVLGGLTGDRGTVGYSKGVAQQLNSLIDDFLSTDGVLTQRMGDFNKRLDAIGESRTKLNERLTSMETMLRAQFQAMDAMVSKMKATGDYLTSQFTKSSG
jgi:flagellar hook-associated protein 2